MSAANNCEYCDRPIMGEPVSKVLRSKKHTFCSEFCFRLYFYDVPRISYTDLLKMYSLRCVSIQTPDLRKLLGGED
jgi:hypothetical protein